MATKNTFIEINESQNIVERFFENDKPHVISFMQLIKYANAIDGEIAVKYNNSIIGASRIDSVFFFYISKLNDRYAIKFKHLDSKIPFDEEDISFPELKHYCKEAIEYVDREGIEKVEPATRKTSEDIESDADVGFSVDETGNPYFYPDYLSQFDKEFQGYKPFFENNKDVKITEYIFTRRVKNALAREDIVTLGDLVNLSIFDIYKIRGIGTNSIYEILRSCKLLCPDNSAYTDAGSFGGIAVEINPPGFNEGDYWEDLQDKVSSIITPENMPDIDTERIADDVVEAYVKRIEDLLICYAKSLKRIKERELDIFVRRATTSETLESISKDYDVTRERIRQLNKKAIRKIQYGLIKGTGSSDEINKINESLIDADEVLVWEVLSYFKCCRKEIWGCLRGVLAKKNVIQNIEQALDLYIEATKQDVGSDGSEPLKEKSRKRYSDWAAEYPEYVVVKKMGYYYSSYGNSALILNELLGYKLVYTSKNNLAYTGGTSRTKIEEALQSANISYIVVESEEIVAVYDGKKKADLICSNSNGPEETENVDVETGEITEPESDKRDENHRYTKELISMLSSRYGFIGFYHYTDFDNLGKILDSGYLICRSMNKNQFTDAADQDALIRAPKWIFDQVRLFYFPLTPFLYKNEGVKPNKNGPHMPRPVALIFDARIALLDGVKHLDGSAINLTEDTNHQTQITKEAKEALSFNWDLITYRGPVPKYGNGITQVFGETNGASITNHKNAEMLLPGRVSIKMLKEIKFRSAADLKQAVSLYGENSLFSIDPSVFNKNHSFLSDYDIEWDQYYGSISIMLKYWVVDNLNRYSHVIKFWNARELLDEVTVDIDNDTAVLEFENYKDVTRIEYYMQNVLCVVWENKE